MVHRPASATHALVAAVALLAFLLAVLGLRLYLPFGDNMVASALMIIFVTAAAIFGLDLFWQKVYLRLSTGLDFAVRHPNWPRSLLKLLGLLSSLGFVGLLYWLFPEYHGDFYDRYYQMLRLILPPWLLLALPYIYWVDSHMTQPRDGYWHMGKLLLLQWREVDGKVLGQHLLGWLIKGFFFPLMFTYMCSDLAKFLSFDLTKLSHFGTWFDFLYDFMYFIDVALVSMGYLMSLRITDTHLRSAEPTMLGWTVALVCYQPFWSLFGRQYLAYDSDYKWGVWLWNSPLLYGLWGGAILLLTAIYVWATVIFGARFSNLTHRGIITNGPYRFTKHPAYVAKNLSWWMISIPFMAQGGGATALRLSFLLLLLSGIYFLRAKTEERHLSNDPDYVAYARWVDAYGVFRFLNPLESYVVKFFRPAPH